MLQLLLLLIFLARPSCVQAQVEPEKTVYDLESYAQDIRQLTTQYRGELHDYRQTESTHQVAKQQYQQLQTLASLEEALRSTQDAMWLRAQVLMTYLRLLRFELLAQPGIEIGEKQAAEKNLLEAVAALKEHQAQLESTLDKPELQQVGLEFSETLGPQVEEAAYQALVNLKIGRLQTIYDKSLVLHQEMEAELATVSSSLETAARQRSFAENERLLVKVQLEFDQVEAELAERDRSRYKSLYWRLQDPLNELYVSLRQVLTYLSELLKEI